MKELSFPLVLYLACYAIGAPMDPQSDEDCIDPDELPIPQLSLSMDKASATPHRITGHPYNFAFQEKYDSKKEFIPGIVNEGLLFNGDFFLKAADTDASCLSDLDLCLSGFTLTMWIKPTIPWQGDDDKLEYLVKFGEGNDEEFGLTVGFRRNLLVVRALGRQKWHQLNCKMFVDPEEKQNWMFVSVRRRGINIKRNTLFVHKNGEKVDCIEQPAQPAKKSTDTNTDMIIGGRLDRHTGEYVGMYRGAMDDVHMYTEWVPLSQIRLMWREGKPAVLKLAQEKRRLFEELAQELEELF